MDDPFCMRHPVFHVIDRMLCFMTQTYERVLPVRFDLHFPDIHIHDGSNAAIQYFARRMVQHYAFHGVYCLYVIVRVESEGTGPPCYLCLFLFDGAACPSCLDIYHQGDYLWRDTLGYEGSGLLRDGYPAAGLHLPPLSMICRPSASVMGDQLVRQQAFDHDVQATLAHGEHLARMYSRCHVPRGVRALLASQIPA